mgnify:CR=1 FL=1
MWYTVQVYARSANKHKLYKQQHSPGDKPKSRRRLSQCGSNIKHWTSELCWRAEQACHAATFGPSEPLLNIGNCSQPWTKLVKGFRGRTKASPAKLRPVCNSMRTKEDKLAKREEEGRVEGVGIQKSQWSKNAAHKMPTRLETERRSLDTNNRLDARQQIMRDKIRSSCQEAIAFKRTENNFLPWRKAIIQNLQQAHTHCQQ